MKKILAILLSFLCVVLLFCGCSDSKNRDGIKEKNSSAPNSDKNSSTVSPNKNNTALNLLGCGFEFGMTKGEINEIGRKITKSNNFDVDSIVFKEGIDRDRIIQGASEDLLPYKTTYYFDDEEKLYCIDFWLPNVELDDAIIIINNIESIYGKADEYKENCYEETKYYAMFTYAYEDRDMQVYITYDYWVVTNYGTIEFYIIAPNYEVPKK